MSGSTIPFLIYIIFVAHLLSECCIQTKDDSPAVKKANSGKKLTAEQQAYTQNLYDCHQHDNNRIDCIDAYLKGCSWFCRVLQKNKGESFNAKFHFSQKEQQELADDKALMFKTETEAEELKIEADKIGAKIQEMEENDGSLKELQETKSKFEQINEKIQHLNNKLTKWSEPEMQMTDKILEAIRESNEPSDYYNNYDLLTWDENGVGEIYSFHPDFIANAKGKTAEMKVIDNLIAKFEASRLQQLGQKRQTCREAALANQMTIGPPCTNLMVEAPRRRLINMNESVEYQYISNSTRRRLSHGTELFSNAAGADFSLHFPEKAAGLLRYSKCAPRGGGCTWTRSDASASLIIANQREGGFFADYYDYILTVGHNMYCHPFDSGKCPTLATGISRTDPRRFAQDISFHLAPGGAVTHPAANLKQVWIPVYRRTHHDDLDKHPHDYAIIKYRSRVFHDYSSRCAIKTNLDHRFFGLTFVGQGLFRRTMVKVSNVIPDPLTDHPHDPVLYFVNPVYTNAGKSGSPLFGFTSRVIVAVHVGQITFPDGTMRSVHNRLTDPKINNINGIIARNFEHLVAFASAKLDYDDIMNQFAYQGLQNEYDQRLYENNKRVNNEQEEYYHFEPIIVDKYDRYPGYNNYHSNLQIYSLMMILIVSLCVCGICVAIASYLCGVVTVFGGFSISTKCVDSEYGDHLENNLMNV